VSQKTRHVSFGYNFSKFRPIFKILLLADSQGTNIVLLFWNDW